MKVEKAPLESYADIGGLEDQIQEIKEAVELPLAHPELYEDIGIKPPKVRNYLCMCVFVCAYEPAGVLRIVNGFVSLLRLLLVTSACRFSYAFPRLRYNFSNLLIHNIF